MRATDDRKTSAIIRDAAMELFAARGVADVTIRDIASAAAVSPSLVVHHFGSKAGLKDALDHRAAAFVDDMLAELARPAGGGAVTSLASIFADRVTREPTLIAYVRRILLDGGQTADDCFGRLFEVTLAAMRSLAAAGVVHPTSDERTRAAFLLANDLAVVLLRQQIAAAAGSDPLAPDGLARWTAEAASIYADGLFRSAAASPQRAATRHRGRSAP